MAVACPIHLQRERFYTHAPRYKETMISGVIIESSHWHQEPLACQWHNHKRHPSCDRLPLTTPACLCALRPTPVIRLDLYSAAMAGRGAQRQQMARATDDKGMADARQQLVDLMLAAKGACALAAAAPVCVWRM